MNNDSKFFVPLLIILTIIFGGVQWFLVRFTHWSVALVITCLTALFVSSLYVSLKHARPNGGSSCSPNSEYITPMFVVFLFLLCGLALVCHLTQNHLPKMAYILPLSLIIGFAISRYVYNYIDSATFIHTKFSFCDIELEDETVGASVIEEISFKSSSIGFTTNRLLNSKKQPGSDIVRFADKIIFRNYPINAENLFIKEFPFDYSLLKEKKDGMVGFLFWLSYKNALPIKIVFKHQNVVDLYIDNKLVKQYQLNIEDSQKKVFEL